MSSHPAHITPYNELLTQLEEQVSLGLITRHTGQNENAGLQLYTYSAMAVYDRQWNHTNLMARGLILDTIAQRVIATPFPKFFNLQEIQPDNDLPAIPDLPFETFTKLDGSLGIIFYHNGKWKVATKGSLISEQAKWAREWLEEGKHNSDEILQKGSTYLAEIIYPENRIVVDYKGKKGLIILAAYKANGEEYSRAELKELIDKQAHKTPAFELVSHHNYSSISELMTLSKTIDCNSEGWVLRFSNGYRVKIKGDEYCRIHKMVTGLTPLSIWRQMLDGQQILSEIRKQIPEEFWDDFDIIVTILESKLQNILAEIQAAKLALSHLSDKDIGLSLKTLSPVIQKFIFAARKEKLFEPKTRQAIFEIFRPTGNILEGYSASSSIRRIMEDE